MKEGDTCPFCNKGKLQLSEFSERTPDGCKREEGYVMYSCDECSRFVLSGVKSLHADGEGINLEEAFKLHERVCKWCGWGTSNDEDHCPWDGTRLMRRP